MGRNAKPDAVKAALGNPGKRKTRPRAPRDDKSKQIAPSRFAPPEWLVNHVARDIWGDMADKLVALNFLKPTDRNAFGRYCSHLADWIEASETIRVEGKFYNATNVTGDELKRIHPMVKIREIAEKHLVELEDRFGLSPLARQKMLRDQASLPPGSLFDRTDKQIDHNAPDDSEQIDYAPSISPVGILNPARTLN